MWIVKLFADFFMALGAMVFFGVLYIINFKAGKMDASVSTLWFVAIPALFAWLRGEFYHWPKELRKRAE